LWFQVLCPKPGKIQVDGPFHPPRMLDEVLHRNPFPAIELRLLRPEQVDVRIRPVVAEQEPFLYLSPSGLLGACLWWKLVGEPVRMLVDDRDIRPPDSRFFFQFAPESVQRLFFRLQSPLGALPCVPLVRPLSDENKAMAVGQQRAHTRPEVHLSRHARTLSRIAPLVLPPICSLKMVEHEHTGTFRSEQTGKPMPGAGQGRQTSGDRFRWWHDLQAFDSERLQSAIDEFTVEKEARSSSSPGNWVRAADDHLQHAKEHQNEMNAAWSSLKAAQRELIEAWGEMELLIEGDRVIREAVDKLHGWRLHAVSDALAIPALERLRKATTTALDNRSSESAARTPLGVEESMPATLTHGPKLMSTRELAELRNRVKAARRILDEDQDNVYRRLQLLRGHLFKAGCVLAAALLLVLGVLRLVLWLGWSPSDEDVLLSDWRSFLMVMVLGALGASLSGVLTLLGRDAVQRIPDVRAQRNLVWLRPVIGSAAAVIVVGVVRSGLGGLMVDPEAAFVAAMLAGSSERLVSRAVANASAAIIG
jgi:hypothetical protein